MNDYLVLILIVATLILAVLVIMFDRKLKRLLRGRNAQSLEGVIVRIGEELERMDDRQNKAEAHLENIEGRVQSGVKNVSTVRFTSFKNSGDGQSFASAFLSEQGDGVVISTLSLRERTSIFAKPVKRFASEIELTEEEQKAIDHARTS